MKHTTPRQDKTWQHPIDRRSFIRRSGAAATAVALTAGAGTWQEEFLPAAEAATTKDTTTLTIWEFAENRGRWLQSLFPGFRKLYPQANIKIVSLPYATIWPKLVTALLSGSGAPDLVEIEVGAMGQFLKGGEVPFVDLTPYLKSNMTALVASAAYAPWTFKGSIYGIGNEFNPVLMYYRWDLFQKAGIDAKSIKTWDDFVSAGKEFKAKTGAFMVGLPADDWGYWYFIARQRGGGFFDASGNVIVNNDIGVSSLQFLVDMVYKHKIAMLDPGLDQYKTTYYTALSNGAFGVAIGAPWYQGFMKDMAPKGAGKWEITPYPKWDAKSTQTVIHGGTGLGMTNQVANKDLGWKFIEYAMLRPESQLQGFKLENLYPDITSLYGKPILNQPDPYFHNEKPAQYLLEVAGSSNGWVQNPYQTEMNNAWMRLLVPVMQGRLAPKAALDQIAATVKKAMQG